MSFIRARQVAGQAVVIATVLAAVPSRDLGSQATGTAEPIRRTLTFNGAQREYFVHLPPHYDRNRTYWALVVVHGGGQRGSAPFPNARLARLVLQSDLEAIVISPSFPNDDNNASRFPSLREGEFLEAVLNDVRRDHALRPKILLTGYSRGGQFSHRYALAHPERVAAVAPLASGTWTTPDGRFLVEDVGEVRNARAFLADTANATRLPARFRDLFGVRIAEVAEAKAATGSRDVPFLVMCGTLDPRLPIAQEFARSLQSLGYQVSVEWPRTPHSCLPADEVCRSEHAPEFEKYLRRTVDFFREYTQRK